jgi:hypothetical protein
MVKIQVCLEVGKKRVIAWAREWPGWCRMAKSEAEALEALAAYAGRYAAVAKEAGLELPDVRSVEAFEVVERLAGKPAYIEMGIPIEITAADRGPLDATEAERLARLVEATWTVFDRVVAKSPAELRKGPRGGGRDRDKMIDHVLGAEAAYARKLGVTHRQPAGDDTKAIAALRADILAVLGAASDGSPPVPNGWPPRYAARRIAWHVLDHAWEMEDRSTPDS